MYDISDELDTMGAGEPRRAEPDRSGRVRSQPAECRGSRGARVGGFVSYRHNTKRARWERQNEMRVRRVESSATRDRSL